MSPLPIGFIGVIGVLAIVLYGGWNFGSEKSSVKEKHDTACVEAGGKPFQRIVRVGSIPAELTNVCEMPSKSTK